MTHTQVVFVGHHRERLLESITNFRKYPVSRIVLVLGDDDTTGEQISHKVAARVKTDLSPVFSVSLTRMDKRNILNATSQIIDLVLKEQKEGFRCILNVSGSLRTFAIAAYIAGCLTGSPMITSIPRYDEEDREIGVEEIVELPAIPVQFPRKDQIELLEAIARSGSSFEDLILQVNPKARNAPEEKAKERGRLAHHLRKIEEMGFVTKEKAGKQVIFSLSPLGRIFAKVCEAEE